MVQRFKTGDTVILKTGTQRMTIAIDHMGMDFHGVRFFNGTYRCIWVDENGDKKTRIFPENDLIVENTRKYARVGR